jgi:hypothetical protein
MAPGGDGACWGWNPGGSVWAVWALEPNGASDQPRPGGMARFWGPSPQIAMRHANARCLAPNTGSAQYGERGVGRGEGGGVSWP